MIGLSWREDSTTAIELVFILKNGFALQVEGIYQRHVCMYVCMYVNLKIIFGVFQWSTFQVAASMW
jgi:hypothetical protein